MKLKKRNNGIWYACYTDSSNRQRSISTGARNKKDAQRVADDARIPEIEATAKAGAVGSETFDRAVLGKKGVTIDLACTEWSAWLQSRSDSQHTVQGYTDRVLRWIRDTKIGRLKCSQLTQDHIDNWVNGDDKGKVTNRRVLLSSVTSFVDWMNIKGYVLGNPAKLARIKMSNLSHKAKEKKDIKLFTDKEVQALLSMVHPDEPGYGDGFWFCAIVFGRYAGMRIGDICQLHNDSLERSGYLTIWTDKRQTRVEIPLSNTFLQQAVLWLPNSTGYFWPVRAMESKDPKVRSKTSVQFLRLCEKLDILGKSFHGLRHTFANTCMDNGVSYPHIAALMGHMSEKTTRQHYLKQAIEKDG